MNFLPHWIYPDILFALTDWTKVLGLMGQDINHMDNIIMAEHHPMGIFHFTRSAHKACSTARSLRDAIGRLMGEFNNAVGETAKVSMMQLDKKQKPMRVRDQRHFGAI